MGEAQTTDGPSNPDIPRPTGTPQPKPDIGTAHPNAESVTTASHPEPSLQGLPDILQKVIGITAEDLSKKSRKAIVDLQNVANPQEYQNKLEALLPQIGSEMRDKDKAEQLQRLEDLVRNGDMTPEQIFTALKDNVPSSVSPAEREEFRQDITDLEEASKNPNTNWEKIKEKISKVAKFLSMGWLITLLLNLLNKVTQVFKLRQQAV